MQTKNINHEHDPQGFAHKNCELSEAATLPKDRMYASTGALCQATEQTSGQTSTNKLTEQSKSWASNIHRLFGPLRSSKNKISGQSSRQTPQTNDSESTPQMSSSALRRQTSLSVLEVQRTPQTGQRHGIVDGYATLPQTDRNSMNVNLFVAPNQYSQSSSELTNCPQMSANSVSNGAINLMDNTAEEENDSFHIRDVCSKWFGHKQSLINQTISSQMVSAVNKPLTDSPNLSLNMKNSLSDKVVTKDVIGHQNSIRSIGDVCEITSDRTESVNEQHVVVVNGLGYEPNRSTLLTVRPDLPSLSPYGSNSPEASNVFSSANPVNSYLEVKDVVNVGDSARICDINYKSSSDSGHGTIRSQNGQQTTKDGVSPLDLTSLDSDQSVNGVSPRAWTNHNVPNGAVNDTNCSNEKIEKMQRELKRILSNNPSDDIGIDLSRNFQTRLSIVKESDSWTSDSPSPAPHPHQSSTSAKYYETKKEIKCSVNEPKTYITSKPKPKYMPQENPINSYGKTKVCADRTAYTPRKHSKCSPISNVNPKRLYQTNQNKVRTNMKRKDSFDQINNCDIVSTTTARDSNYDDLSSECTSLCVRERDNDNAYALRKQLQGLENMYAEIFELLGSRVKSDTNFRNKRKVFRSTSSVVSGRSSVTSRGTRDRRHKHEFKRHKYDETWRRVKRLECHVITLARSVAQLSTDIRYNQSLSQEMDRLRQDVDLIRNQMMALKQSLIPINTAVSSLPRAHPTQRDSHQSREHQSNGHISANGRQNGSQIINPNKVEKLKRFFGDEPPLLRQFLKKLGYEKYARNFESEKIGITELPYLSEERMQKLGIPLGPRMRIMQEWQQRLDRQQTPQPSQQTHHKIKSNSHLNQDSYSIYAIV